LASYSKKPVNNFSRGDKVEGEVIALTASEVIIDFGGKSEGLINKKEFIPTDREKLTLGDKISAYVVNGEGELGQIILSLKPPLSGKQSQKNIYASRRFEKFSQAMGKKVHFIGKVVELNKGGFVVEAEGIRGFLPISQIALKQIRTNHQSEGLEGLIGAELSLKVIEVDPANNKLIFSTRQALTEEEKEKIGKLEIGQQVKGQVELVAPFGLLVQVKDPSFEGEVEGVIFSQEISWERETDLESSFQVGQQIQVQVIGKDENLGRISLSLKRLSADPFEKLSEEFEMDDVVQGVVTEASGNGIVVKLSSGVEGFIPASKIEQGLSYNAGQKVNVLVDSIDNVKRRVNLAPFLTSTKGLLYK